MNKIQKLGEPIVTDFKYDPHEMKINELVDAVNDLTARLEEIDSVKKTDPRPTCSHQEGIFKIIAHYRPGQGFLTSNGDSQKYWKLREKCCYYAEEDKK